jgi:hypothetical protein
MGLTWPRRSRAASSYVVREIFTTIWAHHLAHHLEQSGGDLEPSRGGLTQ